MPNTNPPILFTAFQSDPYTRPCDGCGEFPATTPITSMTFTCDACADEKIGPDQAATNRKINAILDCSLKEQRNAKLAERNASR